MPHALIGSRAKLNRAQEHLSGLCDATKSFDELHAKGGGIDFRKEGDYWVASPKPLPDDLKIRLAIICGDFVNNVRTALDYSVCDIASSFTKKEPTGKNAFPMTKHANEFSSNVRFPKKPEDSPLFGIPVDGEAWTVIEKAQPYGAGDAPPVLATLSMLSNRDKHRALHVAESLTDPRVLHNAVSWGDKVSLVQITYGAINREGQTDAGRYLFHPVDVDPEMCVKSTVPVHHTLGNGNHQATLIGLKAILDTAQRLIEELSVTST